VTKPPKHRRYPKNLNADPMDPSDTLAISESISKPPARSIKPDKITKVIKTATATGEGGGDLP
ncbi:hypothetical protein BdWA1_003339, partial [Babesia duncani]